MAPIQSDEIKISGKSTIRTISDAFQTLNEALSLNKSVIINVDAAEEIDLSFVQLIEAARIQSKSAGIQLSLSAPADGVLLAVLKRGGFLDVATPEDQKFWLHREALQ